MFGRFVPDFGRVVAQMQFDMYHHYTVDEHSIRAIGLLAAIERGELADDHPLSTALFRQIASRRVLYVAVLLHDIAKGRGGDHSELGAEIALGAVPALRARRGRDRDRRLAGALPSAAVAHRLPPRPRRPQDDRRFRRHGAKPRAAAAAADPDRGRHSRGRARHLERVEAAAAPHPVRRRRGAAAAGPQAARPERAGRRAAGRARRGARLVEARPLRAHARRLPDSYWLAEPPEWQVANARQIAAAEARIGDAGAVASHGRARRRHRARPGCQRFRARPAGPVLPHLRAALAAAGASIVDARIHTTRDGMALDNLLVTDARGRAYADQRLRDAAGRGGRAGAGASAEPPAPAEPAAAPRSSAFASRRRC